MELMELMGVMEVIEVLGVMEVMEISVRYLDDPHGEVLVEVPHQLP